MSAPLPVLTVGHSTRPLDELLALLAAHRIEALVDVRRFPGSRRHPQYSRDALAVSLAAAGIAYRHDPRLGGRRAPRPDSPHTAWRNPSFRAYADHMDTAEFRAALADLAAASTTRRTAVMCAEAVPWRCHRRLIADALTATGREVLHLLGPSRAEVHQLHEDAEVLEDGRLLYRAPGDRQGDLFGSE